MHRIDSSGATAQNGFTEGDPQTSTPATVVSSAWLNDVQENLAEAIEGMGVALVKGDYYQLERAIIGMSHKIGELVSMEIEEAPVTLAESRSVANPSYPEYNPVIPRHDADHDVTDAHAPDLVTKFRAYKLKVLGTADFSVASVSGSIITLANNTTNDKLLAALQAAGYVNRWFSSGQSVDFEASGPDYAAAGRVYCINLNGTDYAITAISVGSRQITVTGSPASAATCAVYPFRVAGAATTVRLRRLSGFIPVAGGDSDGEILIALAKMDRMQRHLHNRLVSGAAEYSLATTGSSQLQSGTGATATGTTTTGGPVTDGTFGTPRTGKTNDPRSYGVAIYTWARRLLAKTWTNP